MCQGDLKIFRTIVARRTIRKFKPLPVARELLDRLVDAARLAPSAANVQPLEYIVVDDAALKAQVFPCLKWAAYIAPAGDPKPGEEPAAYIVTLVNSALREKMFEYDLGAAMENMILAGLEEGLGSCWMLSIDRDKLRTVLGVPEGYRIDSVLALGTPAEEPAPEVLTDSCKYWKDPDGRLHVPKRPLAAVAHYNKF
jgi:nitroreductase